MLGRGSVEVDLDRVSGDRHRSPDLEEPVRRLERVGCLVASVRQLAQLRADDALRVGEELVHRGGDPLAPSPGAELVDPPVRERVRRELRAKVAAPFVRIAHPARRDPRAPAASRRVGGITTPSSASVVDPAGRLPGSGPPTSAWCARVTAYPSDVRVTIVRSGRCVPPAYGSFRIHGSPGPGSCARTAATASGIAPRWTGMCSACVTMPPASSKSAVEQSRRSLMFAENAERTSTAPISSAIARRPLPMTWSSTGDHAVLRSTSVPCGSVSPAQPSGTQAVAPVELEHREARGPQARDR